MEGNMRDELAVPQIVDRSTFQAELDALRVREKAHTREGDAIAAHHHLFSLRRMRAEWTPLGHVPVARPRTQGTRQGGVWWRRHNEYDKR